MANAESPRYCAAVEHAEDLNYGAAGLGDGDRLTACFDFWNLNNPGMSSNPQSADGLPLRKPALALRTWRSSSPLRSWMTKAQTTS